MHGRNKLGVRRADDQWQRSVSLAPCVSEPVEGVDGLLVLRHCSTEVRERLRLIGAVHLHHSASVSLCVRLTGGSRCPVPAHRTSPRARRGYARAMSDLVEFILARVGDDDRIATAALDGAPVSLAESTNGHVPNWGTERVLRECGAKLTIANDLEKWERIYDDAAAQLAARPDDEDARNERDEAHRARFHSRVAAIAVADIWKDHPAHVGWQA